MRLSSAIAGVAGVVVFLLPALVLAADSPPSKPAASPQNVELFTGMKDGRLDVTIIPNNSEVAHLRVRNLTKAPINVQLPKAFAAVPVLAQFGPMNGGLNGGGQGQGNGGTPGFLNGAQTPQVIGTGNNPNNPNKNNNPPGVFNVPGGMQNIPAGRVGDMRLTCVCLQYGHPDPSPNVPYEVVKLETVSKSQELRAVLEEMAAGMLERPVAQLAAWHYANDLSLKQLAGTGYAPTRIKETAGVIERLDKAVALKNAPAVAADEQPIVSSQSRPSVR
jgi:hypothetical protein